MTSIVLYRPSNGTEGEIFMAHFCERCAVAEEKDYGPECDILMRTMAYDVNDLGYPTEWRRDENGQPTCTAFVQKEEERDPI